jgi:hypothetical protein
MVLVVAVAPIQAAYGQKLTSDLCAKHETEITADLAKGNIREAIMAVCHYEEAVRGCYPGPSYENGLFQSEADHLSFFCPFDTWTRIEAKDSGLPDWLPSVGVDFPLILSNKKNSDRLAIMSLDCGTLMRAMGVTDFGSSEKDLSLVAAMLEQSLGVEQAKSYEDIGDHKMFVVELTSQTGDPVEMCFVANLGKIYAFIVICTSSESAELKAKLLSMMKTVDFHFKPADNKKIAAIRAKITDPKDVSQQLQCIRELTLSGEYGDACLDLTNLRLNIGDRIPKPVDSGGVTHFDSYGITLTNPDATTWKSEMQVTGGIPMMLLENNTSVDVNGIAVGVLDPLVIYGVHADKMIGEHATESTKRSVLSGGGRGSLLSMGSNIESERFRTFKGMMAYEGITSTNMPNVKAKVICALKSDYVLFVLLLVDSRDSDHQFSSYEQILDKELILK